MDRKMSSDLDRHITDNYGEDQFKEPPIEPKPNFAVVMKGGSLGEIVGKPSYKGRVIVQSGLTKEEAKELAKRRRKALSHGEKGYYKIGYSVVEIKKGE